MSVAGPSSTPSLTGIGAPLAATPRRVRLRCKQAVPTIPAPALPRCTVDEPVPITTQPNEITRMRRQLLYQLSKFRHGGVV